jgi:GxxExxY protein
MTEEAHPDPASGKVIGLSIEVHRHLGPGLLESAYEDCLAFELREHGIGFRRQVALSVVYKGMQLGCSYRMDFVVEEYLVLEIKAVDHLLAIHEAQLLTYLKLSNRKIGLLINFNVPLLRDGIKRMAR